jgi:hypothetical protein
LAFEPLKTLKGQVIVDFIIEHGIDLDDEINYLTLLSRCYTLMDQFVKMAKMSVLFLFLPMVLKLKCQADWILIALIIRLNMKLYYLVDYVAFHGSKAC